MNDVTGYSNSYQHTQKKTDTHVSKSRPHCKLAVKIINMEIQLLDSTQLDGEIMVVRISP
jgi:hypothetical protein